MTAHIKFWLAALLLTLLATPVLTSQEELRQIAARELGMMQSSLGTSATNKIVINANSAYTGMFVNTGIVNRLKKGETTEESRETAGKTLGGTMYSFTTMANDYLLSAITLLYISILRVSMLMGWVPFLLPFVGAAIVDGSVRYKINKISVRISSPIQFKASAHIVIVCAIAPLLYLVAPMAITPYFILGWAIVIGFSAMFLVSELMPTTHT